MNPRIASLEASQDPDSTSHHGRPALKITADRRRGAGSRSTAGIPVLAAAPAVHSTEYLSSSWAPRVGTRDSEVETRGAVRRRGGGVPAREHMRRRSGERASTAALRRESIRGGAAGERCTGRAPVGHER
jgi:hypothetical protein